MAQILQHLQEHQLWLPQRFELIDKEEGIFKDIDVDEATINTMIMKAREKWFVEEK